MIRAIRPDEALGSIPSHINGINELLTKLGFQTSYGYVMHEESYDVATRVAAAFSEAGWATDITWLSEGVYMISIERKD